MSYLEKFNLKDLCKNVDDLDNYSKPLLILSGGQDSGTLLRHLATEFNDIVTLSVTYGQKGPELDYAKKNVDDLINKHPDIKVKSLFVDLSGIYMKSSSNIMNDDIKSINDKLEDTYVPSRNTLLLNIASIKAQEYDCDCVFYGAELGDFNSYPDCRPEFLKAFNNLNKVNNYIYIPVFAPYMSINKVDICGIADETDYDVWNLSYSCYNGELPACGECHSCDVRNKSFDEYKDLSGKDLRLV